MQKDRINFIGEQVDLSKGPGDMRQSAFAGGMAQMIGTEMDLSSRTVPMGVFDKGVRGGSMDMGDITDTPLNRTPQRGWDSYDTPISGNSETPSTSTSGYPGKGR